MPGSVRYADWSLSWSIPNLSGQGLVIHQASYRGISVLYRGEQPFALIPYHGDGPTFKEGLRPACGGVAYRALRPTAPNATISRLPTNSFAANDNEYDALNNPSGAVKVERVPATLIEPAKLVIWVKMQVGNYQYIHRWEFWADGTIHPSVGLGGRLLKDDEETGAHFHHFYFRLDFDLVTAEGNLVQRFAHTGNAPGDDVWTDITVESRQTVDLATHTRWRILNTRPKPNGKFPSYELIPQLEAGPDGTYSTGDLWVMLYKETSGGLPAETGASVGCTDEVLSTSYVNGESVNGEDIVVWYCLHHHHVPRSSGEERTMIPYTFIGFELEPRDFLDNTPTNLYPTAPPSPLQPLE